jgi:hypothetical protein
MSDPATCPCKQICSAIHLTLANNTIFLNFTPSKQKTNKSLLINENVLRFNYGIRFLPTVAFQSTQNSEIFINLLLNSIVYMQLTGHNK